MVKLEVRAESWPIRGHFAISRGSRTEAHVVTVELRDGDHFGRGECVPYARYGETPESVIAQIENLRDAIATELDSDKLQDALTAGAARNALDCAFWDLDCKSAGKRIWEMAYRQEAQPLITAYTLSLDTPENMQAAARENADRPLLKLKLAGPDDLERVEAVRAGAPKAEIIVDANEGWTRDIYTSLAPELLELGVKLIEQPLPAGEDDVLGDMARPVPVCADESCHDRRSLAELEGKYDFINIKLDKTGGLTEALALKVEAEKRGFGIMVGCMLGTSLAMAPAHLIAQGAGIVDLDGPLLLEKDREPPLRYEGSTVYPPDAALWG